MLKAQFAEVKSFIYKDSLRITDSDDLVDYLNSLASFKAILDFPGEKVKKIIEAHEINGVIDLPKEYGMFIAG